MTMLPETLVAPIGAVLRAADDSTPVHRVRPVGGGCINHALRLDTDHKSYLLKWNAQPLPDMFLVEAQGLALLAATEAIRVPAVIAASNTTAQHPAYILLEWLEGAASPSSQSVQATLGRQLARMHQASAAAYGLDHNNYLGEVPQYNGWSEDWVHFYRERRLRPHMELAQRNGRLSSARRRGLEHLMGRLDEVLGGVERRPSLLHGDLWGGNVIVAAGDVPALIDPAVYYGDREAELAYTELFGGFSTHFYQGYQEVWPLDAGYADRRDLYNLYHLLNHLNHFGESYGSGVDAVIRRYGG